MGHLCHITEASIFRGQLQTTAEASRRPRAPRSRPITFSLDVPGPSTPSTELTLSNVGSLSNPALWLNEEAYRMIPPSIYGAEDKALMRFLAKWTLHPCNHGVCPGVLDYLPSLATRDNVVSLAVEATIFVDVSETSQDRNSALLRSHQKYGQALKQIGKALESPESAVAETTIAAILIIDSLEVRLSSLPAMSF